MAGMVTNLMVVMDNSLMVDMDNNLTEDMVKNLTAKNMTNIQPLRMNNPTVTKNQLMNHKATPILRHPHLQPMDIKNQLMNHRATPILLLHHLHPTVTKNLRMENMDIQSLHIDSKVITKDHQMATNKDHHMPKVKLALSKVC